MRHPLVLIRRLNSTRMIAGGRVQAVWKRVALIAGIFVLVGAGVAAAYLAGRQPGGHPAGQRPAAATKPAAIAVPASPNASPPPPSPVATSASLTGNCVMGYETFNAATYAYGRFHAGSPPASTGRGYGPALAYQLTLTNDSSNTADVAQFAVVFYDSTGAEAGSDTQYLLQDTFITPAQSLTWTEMSNTATNGTGTGGTDHSIPANAASCQLVQWYHP